MAIQEIKVDELAELLESGVRLIDVREPAEYAEARVPGGVLVPLGTVPDQVDAFRGRGFDLCDLPIRRSQHAGV